MKRITILILLAISVATSFIVGVNHSKSASMEPAKKNAINPSARFHLNTQQISELTTKAKNGDVDSAYKLYQHYEMTTDDSKSSIYWLEKAASMGHPIARYNIAVTYIYDEKYKNHEKAMYWLQKGIAAGDPKSKELFNRYRNR